MGKQHGVIKFSFLTLILVFSFSCVNKKAPSELASEEIKRDILIPSFNADSAYAYVKKQVEFGPRVPNSKAHENCYKYLVKTLKRFGGSVIVQQEAIKRYDGVNMNMKNIIASFNNQSYKRVLLCAHWDSRFIADNDVSNVDKPILGANDGGSGVGVLLELARQISINPINIGIDIIVIITS